MDPIGVITLDSVIAMSTKDETHVIACTYITHMKCAFCDEIHEVEIQINIGQN